LQKFLIFIVILAGTLILLLSIPSWLPFGGEKETSVEVTDNIRSIDFDLSGISTIIIPENRSDVEVILDGKGSVEALTEGDQIHIEYQREFFEQFGFFDNTELTVYVPEDYNQDMDIEVGSGNVQFNGKSNMSIDHLEMEVGSGNISIDSLKTKSGVMDISSGNIDLKRYTGQIEADVSSGNLEIQMAEVTGPIELDVSSGRVVLDLPEDAHFTLDGQVSSGHIDNQFDLENIVQNENEVSGVYGTGEHPINLDVSSGVIEIK
jgi:lia operon protein LiaG